MQGVLPLKDLPFQVLLEPGELVGSSRKRKSSEDLPSVLRLLQLFEESVLKYVLCCREGISSSTFFVTATEYIEFGCVGASLFQPSLSENADPYLEFLV